MSDLAIPRADGVDDERRPPPAIDLQSLSVSFDGRVVLSAVDLHVPRGQVTALVGPSGAGKSTILAVISRLIDLVPGARASGAVRVHDLDVLDPDVDVGELRRRLGTVFQRPTPFPLSIRRNLELPLREHVSRDRRVIEGEVQRLLRRVGLWEEVAARLDAPATSLSGGQQQRLCLARALASGPSTLLLDEPCSALDPVATARFETLVHALRGETTIVLVTHNLAQARRLADRVALVWPGADGGRIVFQGAAEAFFAADDPAVRAFVASETITEPAR